MTPTRPQPSFAARRRRAVAAGLDAVAMAVLALAPLRRAGGAVTVAIAAAAVTAISPPPAAAAAAAPATSATAEVLHAARSELQPKLRQNAFGQPLVVESVERKDTVDGEVHAEIPHPFARLVAALKSGDRLCEVMLLHLNVHACRATPGAGGETLAVTVGPKKGPRAGTTHRMNYALRVDAATPSFVHVSLHAAEGPIGTSDYRLSFEAVPIEGGTFLRMRYAYAQGSVAKAAMGIYLATTGRSKVGFTIVGRDREGRPEYVRGERGVLERNVVRYYIALLAYCSVDSGSSPELAEARMRNWYALTERYPRQLHELELDEYLREKREVFRVSSAAR